MRRSEFKSRRCSASWCLLAFVAALLVGEGCSTYATQTYGYLSEAQVAINGARDAGAESLAPTVYSEAVLQFRHARELISVDRFEAARRAAEDARSMAELAQVQARHASAEQRLLELERDVGRIEASWREAPQ